jgi:sec-independent protein translocase protein TatC
VSVRSLWRGWRYAVVLITVVSAVITPTVDPVTMTLVALPMVALYFLGIFLALFARRGKASPGEGPPPARGDRC